MSNPIDQGLTRAQAFAIADWHEAKSIAKDESAAQRARHEEIATRLVAFAQRAPK